MKTTINTLTILMCLFSTLQAQIALDTNFNHTGIVKTNLPGTNPIAASALQSSGKIIVAGNNALLRYNATGSIDSSFGINGMIDSITFVVRDVAIQSDDKIVLGGGSRDFTLSRYHPDGRIDSSFGINGIVINNVSPISGINRITRIQVLSNGMILAGGYSVNSSSMWWIGQGAIFERYNSDGSLDTTFIKDPTIRSNCNGVRDFEILPNGKILFVVTYQPCLGNTGYITCGNGTPETQIFRLHSNGMRDTTFAWGNTLSYGHRLPWRYKFYTPGPTAPVVPSQVFALKSRSNGKIVITCAIQDSIGLIGLKENGDIDSTFGTYGFAANALDTTKPRPMDILLVSGGKTLVCGSNKNGDFFLARFDSTGALDNYCNKGYITTNIDSNDEAKSMLIQTNGHVLLVGTSSGDVALTSYDNIWLTKISINDSSCLSYKFNGKSYTTSGVYMDTLSHSANCDSIVFLNLTINQVDVKVTQIGNVLYSSVANAKYQWINCNTGNPLAGDTNQTFIATSNGDYAVIVNQNGCSDTSTCFSVIGLGISSLSSTNLKVYPNPNNGSFKVDFGQKVDRVIVEVVNLQGQVVFQQELNHVRLSQVGINQPKGMYLVKLCLDGETILKKMLIE